MFVDSVEDFVCVDLYGLLVMLFFCVVDVDLLQCIVVVLLDLLGDDVIVLVDVEVVVSSVFIQVW